MKDKCYVFTGYKNQNKVFSKYLESKVREDGYIGCILELKRYKTVGGTYLETSKQQRRY